MVIFGSVFKNEIAPGVKYSQYFVAGMIASGMVNSGFQQLAIMIPMERDAGALKRLRGTPMPIASYFIGKSILVLASMIAQTILLVAGGVAFFGLKLPATADKWWLFVLLLVLGSANSTALGIAFSAIPKCSGSVRCYNTGSIWAINGRSTTASAGSCKSRHKFTRRNCTGISTIKPSITSWIV